MRYLQTDPFGHCGLFIASINEKQVFLTTVKKAGGLSRTRNDCAFAACHFRVARVGFPPGSDNEWLVTLTCRSGHERLDFSQCRETDAGTIAQSTDKLSVIDGLSAERGFRHTLLATKCPDCAQ